MQTAFISIYRPKCVSQVLVVGSSERPKSNIGDLFISNGRISLKDDNNIVIADDYTRFEGIKCLTGVADWVFFPNSNHVSVQ